jgi:hypothetical protein
MDTFLQFLPILTSTVIAVLFYSLKLKIKKLVDLSIEKEKKILENKYKTLYEEKINLNKKLEVLYNSYLDLNTYLKENHKEPENKVQIEKLYFDISNLKRKTILFCSSQLRETIEKLFRFANGYLYIEYFKFNKEEYDNLKIDFEKYIKNERQN